MFLVCALLTSLGGNISSPKADTIKKQQAAKKKLEKKRKAEAEKAEKLKIQSDEIQDAIKELDEKKQDIELKIADHTEKISKTESSIAKVDI